MKYIVYKYYKIIQKNGDREKIPDKDMNLKNSAESRKKERRQINGGTKKDSCNR